MIKKAFLYLIYKKVYNLNIFIFFMKERLQAGLYLARKTARACSIEVLEFLRNFRTGFVSQQEFTTFGIGIYRNQESSPEQKDISVRNDVHRLSYIERDEIETRESKESTQAGLGALCGFGLDLACSVGAGFYVYGSDNKLAALAASVIGIKLLTNTAHAADYCFFEVTNRLSKAFSSDTRESTENR
jgi:hypothetical protein